MACDFRFQKDALKGLKYAVCGLGNSLYAENFNKVAIDLDKSFAELQASSIAPLYCCDENTVRSEHSSLEGDFGFWEAKFLQNLENYHQTKIVGTDDGRKANGGCCGGNGKAKSTVIPNGCCQNNGKEKQNCSTQKLALFFIILENFFRHKKI